MERGEKAVEGTAAKANNDSKEILMMQ